MVSPILRDRKLGISLVKAILVTLATSALVVAGCETMEITASCEQETESLYERINIHGAFEDILEKIGGSE